MGGWGGIKKQKQNDIQTIVKRLKTTRNEKEPDLVLVKVMPTIFLQATTDQPPKKPR